MMVYSILWRILKSPVTWVIIGCAVAYMYVNGLQNEVEDLRQDAILTEADLAVQKGTIAATVAQAEKNAKAVDELRGKNRKMKEKLDEALGKLSEQRNYEDLVRKDPAGAESRINTYIDGLLHETSCATGKQCDSDTGSGASSSTP